MSYASLYEKPSIKPIVNAESSYDKNNSEEVFLLLILRGSCNWKIPK
jgi:hypothetical protein